MKVFLNRPLVRISQLTGRLVNHLCTVSRSDASLVGVDLTDASSREGDCFRRRVFLRTFVGTFVIHARVTSRHIVTVTHQIS